MSRFASLLSRRSAARDLRADYESLRDDFATLVAQLDLGTLDATTFSASVTLANGANLVLGTGSGTKIGTAAGQKVGFYNATPVAQQTGVAVDAAGIHAALVALGLITA